MTPEAPELLFEGKELAFMTWWFHRMTRVEGAIPPEDVAAYASAYSGHDRLRGGFAHYHTLLEDARDNQILLREPLRMLVFAIGGEKGGKDRLAWSCRRYAKTCSTRLHPPGILLQKRRQIGF
jgi:hypothetical protein